MNSLAIIQAYAEDTGWNDNSMLLLVCQFLDAQEKSVGNLESDFHEYLTEVAEEAPLDPPFTVGFDRLPDTI
jgi:hypothetical protein